MPQIERRGAGAGDDVGDAGLRLDPSGGADPALVARDVACREREARRAGQRVAPQMHRRRAGVRGLAAKGDLVTLGGEGAGDDSQRQAHRLEHRSLLDVELEVGGGAAQAAAGLEHAVEAHAAARQHVGHRLAVAVAQATSDFEVEASRRGARAEQAQPEARAFLVGPVDQAHGDRGHALRRDASQHLEARQHVERAVEPPAVGDRVEVAADEELLRRASFERRPAVAGLVGLDGDGESGEVLGEPVTGARPDRRPAHALRAAVVAGEAGELAQLRYGARWIERHGSGAAYHRDCERNAEIRPASTDRNLGPHPSRPALRRRCAGRDAA